jgi:lipoprotein-anchoring transpeptidase ErfK/SrfK
MIQKMALLTLLWCAASPAYSEDMIPLPAMVHQDVQKAEKLWRRSESDLARKIYEKILTRESGLTAKQKKDIRRKYESMNMKTLFSPLPMKEAKFHKVKKGETLLTIAKKYRTTVELIKKSNRLKSDVIQPEMRLKVIKEKFYVFVDKSENQLILFLNGNPFKRYRVATGKKNSTPAGTFKIVNRIKDPTWYTEGRAVRPEDPKNELGSHWLGFDLDSYGIHGTSDPDSIGNWASSGCVRMHNHDVGELYTILPEGTKVHIQD